MKRKNVVLATVALAGCLSLVTGLLRAENVVQEPNAVAWNAFLDSGTAATANLLSASEIWPGNRGAVKDTTYRFSIAIASSATSSVIFLRVTHLLNQNPATPDTYWTAQDFALNQGGPLLAGTPYNFAFNACSDFTYNFRAAAVTTVAYFTLDRRVQ